MVFLAIGRPVLQVYPRVPSTIPGQGAVFDGLGANFLGGTWEALERIFHKARFTSNQDFAKLSSARSGRSSHGLYKEQVT